MTLSSQTVILITIAARILGFLGFARDTSDNHIEGSSSERYSWVVYAL